jgi:outer membrane receptor protein involved in Fe transport
MSDQRIRHPAVACAVLLALASAAASAQEGATALSEITVTAQKRTESLQDVPIAVSAVSGTKIAQAGIMKIEDLKNYVPTLFMTETAIGNNISIRGIFSGVNPGFEQSVGTYVDGIYRGRPQQTRAPFLDLERVEVLRGPQSILFGKNSVAGALNITTARPTKDFDAMVSALYEPRYEEQEFTAHVSGPFSDRFRARLAASYRELDGPVYNATLNTEDPGREEKTARAWFEFDVTDSLTASLKAEHGEFDVTGRQIEITTELPAAAGPFTGLTYSQILAAFGQSPTVLNNTADYVRSSNGDFSNNDSDEYVLQLDWQVGDNTVTAVTGYSKYSFDELCDCDFTGANVFNVVMGEEFDQTSQEIRLTSPTGGKLEYILGAYYETSDLKFHDSIQVAANSVLVPLLNANPAFNGSPLQGIAGTMIANTGTPREFSQNADSYSAFAQVTVNLSEELRSTFGLRYTNDKKDALRSLFITDINGNPLVGAQAALAPAVYRLAFNVRGQNPDSLTAPCCTGSRSEEQLLPSINMEWSPNDDTMLYASWRQGAKAGGFDARSNNPTAPPAVPCTAPGVPVGCTPASGIGSFEFEPEKSSTYEVGAKLTLGGTFEMNTAFYVTNFENLQVSTFDGVLGFNVRNAGQAEIKGLELDVRWQATPNLLFSSSVAYTDFVFQDYIGQCFFGQPSNAGDGLNCDYSGKTNEFVAPWVATVGANYSHPIGANLMLHVGTDVYYTDEYFVAPTLDPKQKQGSYYKVNGRLGVSDADGSWDVSLVGKNLFNEQILPYGNDTPLAGRTFGAFSAWRFVEPGSTVALQGTVRF